MKCSLDISNFTRGISSLYHSIISSISFHCSLKKPFFSPHTILWNSAFSWIYLSLSPLPFISLLPSAICKASWNNHFASLHFFLFGMVLVTASCTVLWTSFHNSPDTLFTTSDQLSLSSPPLNNHMEFDLHLSWMIDWFSLFCLI